MFDESTNELDMWKLFFVLFMIIGSASSAQDEVRLESPDGNVVVTCLAQRTGIVTDIATVHIKAGLDDEIVQLQTVGPEDLYLHITEADTALFVQVEGERYYLYHLVSDLPEADRPQSMYCMYSNVAYPQHARSESVAGTVVVDAYLDTAGCVVSVVRKTDIGYGLEKATERALKKCSCEFPPVRFQGQSVKSIYTVSMQFRLD